MIDLRSDTVTRPSRAMRDAMTHAPVGDDVYGEDPTVNRLQELAAALLGKAGALYVPSGTMANQLSIRVHTQPGREVIVESNAHIVRYEQGAAAALSGVQLHWVPGERGIMTPDAIAAAIRPKDPYSIQTALICIENTHNSGGGSIYPLDTIARIRALAQQSGIPMHLDGARLFNAVIATGVPASDYAKHFETVSVCLSKGLGAPVGSLIATNDDSLLQGLRRYRRMYGGAMRQAGIVAAAGIFALEHNVARLKEDHDRAQRLARILCNIPTVSLDPAHVETNIIIFEVHGARRTPTDIVASLKDAGVLINAIGGHRFRAVTHLDIGEHDIDEAGRIFTAILDSPFKV